MLRKIRNQLKPDLDGALHYIQKIPKNFGFTLVLISLLYFKY